MIYYIFKSLDPELGPDEIRGERINPSYTYGIIPGDVISQFSIGGAFRGIENLPLQDASLDGKEKRLDYNETTDTFFWVEVTHED